MFEATIRYIGGLLSAYELSGEKYPFLLDKAEQLANCLSFAWSKCVHQKHDREYSDLTIFQGNAVPFPSVDFNAKKVDVEIVRLCTSTIDITRTDVDKCSQISRKLGP
jgi:hypothetical protein